MRYAEESMDATRSRAAGLTAEGTQSLSLRLTFVMSAYDTAQRMIRFSDEKASFVFLFFGILLSIFGIRGDRILLMLGGQARPGTYRLLFIALFLIFLLTMVMALLHGLKTIVPHLSSPVAGSDHHGIYWYRDVLALPVDEYLARLQSLSDETVLHEMAHELYAAMAIERAKFDRISRSLRWALVSFVFWIFLIVMSIGA